jgi:acetylornithine deacetylase/succinyl-diaminopimelate desuccinylase-like protein
MSQRLHDEVIDLAQRLIQIDTTNGNESAAARLLADYLSQAGVDCELVAKDPARANLVARIPGSDPTHPSLAFVGHLDVVPADARDWTHPPFAAVIDDQGYLFGRGAVDMKNEVAARAVAIAELARSGFQPLGDLWFIAVADEEDGAADVGMRWLLAARPDIRPDLAINEGGGERLELADGRSVLTLSVGEKGTQPVRLVALGEAGHASVPTLGDNAVPHLAELLSHIAHGSVRNETAEWLLPTLATLVPGTDDEVEAMTRAVELHPLFSDLLPVLAGTTMAPTMLGGALARNVMPARAWAELDCRILPGTTRADVERAVRDRLRNATSAYALEWPEDLVPGSASPATGLLPDAIAACLQRHDPTALLLPILCTGYTDSSFLRLAAGTAAYGFNPVRTTPADVLAAGYHNANERIHVDDLLLSVEFHLDLAQWVLDRVITPDPPTRSGRFGARLVHG